MYGGNSILDAVFVRSATSQGFYMKLAERQKTLKTVNKIQSGYFDDDDVELLLIRLRAYSGSFKVFKEAGNFVAHNDLRSKGLINEALDAIGLALRFYMDYPRLNRQLNLGEKFPAYIKSLLLRLVDRFEDKELVENTGVGRVLLKRKINNHIKKSGVDECVLEIKKAGKEACNAFAYMFSKIEIRPVFSPNELLEEVFGVLELNQIKYSKELIFSFKDKFVLSFALMLHDTDQELTGGKIGRCSLSFTECINGRELAVVAGIDFDVEGMNITISHSIFETGLPISSCCGSSILNVDADIVRDNLRRPIHLVNGKLELI